MIYDDEIKRKLINNEITKSVKDYSKNKSELNTYYKVGKMILEATDHYGEKIITEYSKRLKEETGFDYNPAELNKMKQFYLMIENGVKMSYLLNWNYYLELLSLKDIYEINYYITICEKQHLSLKELQIRIKNKEFNNIN